MSDSRANPRPSRSDHFTIRSHRVHCRRWHGTAQPLRVFLHGWLDVSETWQWVVNALPTSWDIAAPDQRGFGLSEAVGDTYWFYDYIGDLDALLDQLSPDQPVDLVGHSMGSQVAALYAGVRPERVRKLVALDGFYLPQQATERAPQQLRNWLSDLKKPQEERTYDSLDVLAQKIAARQPGLDANGAQFIARCWSRQTEDGRWQLLGDPRHRQRGPLLYRDEEARAIFREVRAPTLLVDADTSHLANMGSQDVRAQRLACFANAEHRTIKGAGHMLHFDAPEATAQVIAEFLDRD